MEESVRIRTALAALAGVATLATVGAATVATGASASTTTTTTTSHVVYTPSACTVGNLSATLTVGHPSGWNNRELVLTLTNKGYRACTISGYPGLQLLNAKYWPLPTTTTPVIKGIPAKIVLLPGRSVTAEITFAVYGQHYRWNYSGFPFYGASAAYLVVTLPGTHQPSWQHFTLKIPGGPVRVVQNHLYETALVGTHPIFPW
jgi:Domain of unknown function (DUF4232)